MSEAGEPVLSAPAVAEKSDILVDDAAAPEREDDENSLRNESSAATRQSSVDTASAADEKKPGRDHGSAAAPDTVKAADGSQSSKQLAGSSKLEDQINLQHLVELMKIFYEADENGSDGLDIDEFKAAFGQILGKGKKDQQMAVMFMKIDTNCDGTVDWDEFCTFMLLEYQEKDLMEGEKLPLFPYPLKVLPNCHRDNITKIMPLPAPGRHGNQGGGASLESDGRFLSVCRDGTICFWKTNHTLQRMVQVESTRSRFTWVTDLVVMANINKIIVSFTDNTLALYDITTFDLQQQVVGLRHCVLALDYWYDSKQVDHAVLVFGDSGGGVGTCEFFTATSSLFPARSKATCRNQEVPVVTFSELLHYPTKSINTTYLPGIHGDWVAKVLYCPYMEQCMSCSNDSACSLYLVDCHGHKEGSVITVRKGITSFDYSRELNIIATGGLDRIVRLWNPYIPGKPTALLKGHTTAIVHIVLHSTYGELLSFSRDLELRVWNLQDQLCLQVCHRFQQLLPQPPSAFCLHPRTGALLIGTNQLGVLEPCRDDELKKEVGGRRDKTLSHENPLTAALYNAQFNQVVSGCQGGVVSVWDLDTGEKTMQFSRCHGDVELTAMTFDPSGRRLITGGRDGSLKIWNFNNGACLNVLESNFTLEVTSLCFLKQRIIVGGWNQLLSAYSDTRDADGSIPKCFGSGEHREDILCLAGHEPNLLASASYDGDVLLWNLDSERCVGRLNAGCRETRMPRPVFGCTGKRHLKGPLVQTTRRREEEEEDEESAVKRGKDERAVEKLLFLRLREPSPTVGSLVSCGAGGWVQFWNTSGGGLVGEYNVWDTRRHTLPPAERSLHSVTAMHGNETETTLYTGNSLGYLQLWDISSYCLHKSCAEATPTITKTPPPLKLAWRLHLSSIVSIDTAEEAGVVVTASTDCTVRLWSQKGCYIGTFGQRAAWQIPVPPPGSQGAKIINIIPPDLHHSSSFETIHTISGAVKSKWTLAKNLLRALMMSVGTSNADNQDHTHHSVGTEHILGRCYERQTRVRQPIVSKPLRQRDGGSSYAIYSTLHCPELVDPPEIQPPSRTQPQPGVRSADHKNPTDWGVGPQLRDHTHTAASLLHGVL